MALRITPYRQYGAGPVQSKNLDIVKKHRISKSLCCGGLIQFSIFVKGYFELTALSFSLLLHDASAALISRITMQLQLCPAALNHYGKSGFASDNKLLFLAGDINDRMAFDSDKDKS